MTAIVVDISARRQAEESARQSADRFRLMAESMPQKIFTAKPNGDVDYLNQQWSEFTGLPSDEIKEWGGTRFIHPEDVEENSRAWRCSLETGAPFQSERALFVDNFSSPMLTTDYATYARVGATYKF